MKDGGASDEKRFHAFYYHTKNSTLWVLFVLLTTFFFEFLVIFMEIVKALNAQEDEMNKREECSRKAQEAQQGISLEMECAPPIQKPNFIHAHYCGDFHEKHDDKGDEKCYPKRFQKSQHGIHEGSFVVCLI